MTAAPGTIPALPPYQPGALPFTGAEVLELCSSTNATSAASYRIPVTDLVGKAPGVMPAGITPTANDIIAVLSAETGTPFSTPLGNIGQVTGNLPVAGGTGQLLVKKSAANYDAQWSSGLIWDSVNLRLGINTTSPAYSLENVESTTANFRGVASTNYNSSAAGSIFTGRHARGTITSPSALLQGDFLVAFAGTGYGATGFSSGGQLHGGFAIIAAENWSDAAQGTYLSFLNTATGSTTLVERARIDASGNLGIGTTTPAAKLDVSGTGNFSGSLTAVGVVSTTYISSAAPSIQNSNYTMASTDGSLIFNGAGSITFTLQTASLYPGRWLNVKTVANQPVVSATTNVVPLTSTTAGTTLLVGTTGKYARLQSDGTNWVVMEAN